MAKEILIFKILRQCGIENLKGIVKVDMHVTPTEFDLYVERHYAPDDRKYFITNNRQLIKHVEFIDMSSTLTTTER